MPLPSPKGIGRRKRKARKLAKRAARRPDRPIDLPAPVVTLAGRPTRGRRSRKEAKRLAAAPVVIVSDRPRGMPEAGWLPDPYGRAHHRWWNGLRWTDEVITHGARSTDRR